MRRLALAVAVLAVTLAGCETSDLDRAAAVVVSGRVLQADGSPAGGVPVGLEPEPSIGEVLAGLFVIPLTLFTACLSDAPIAALCRGRSIMRTTTASDGGTVPALVALALLVLAAVGTAAGALVARRR